MSKEVTVLAVGSSWLHGVRLKPEGDGLVRVAAESWPIGEAQSEAAGAEVEGGLQDAGETPTSPDASQETVVAEDKPLARAFKAAIKKFETRDFVLAVPLSKLLVKVVRLPLEARDDLLGAASLALDGVSPFPDEVLSPGVEVVAETDKELVALVAALPEVVSAEIGGSLAAARVHVTRTDASALGWLRMMWGELCPPGVALRLVLLNLDDGWDIIVMLDGAPAMVRGIGQVGSAAELFREVTLSLMQCEGLSGKVDEVVVCSRNQPDREVLERLGELGAVRIVEASDEFAGAEGAARRSDESQSIDVTPAVWVEARLEARFRHQLGLAMGVAGVVWLAVMGVLFGVDLTYDLMTDNQKSMQKERRHKRAFKEVEDMTNRVALIERYSDHAHGALEVLKQVSDCLPPSQDMSFRSFKYVRGESVRVQGSAGQREDVRTFTENLESAVFEDSAQSDEPERIFGKVTQQGGENMTKKGVRFSIEATFPSEEEDGTRRKGGK